MKEVARIVDYPWDIKFDEELLHQIEVGEDSSMGTLHGFLWQVRNS